MAEQALKKWGSFHHDHDKTMGEIQLATGLPESEIEMTMGQLGIRSDYSVGGIKIFSQASVLRIRSAIMSAANKKAAAAI